MEEWIQIIGEKGFPLVMCAWFAFRLERVLENIVKTNERILALLEERKNP